MNWYLLPVARGGRDRCRDRGASCRGSSRGSRSPSRTPSPARTGPSTVWCRRERGGVRPSRGRAQGALRRPGATPRGWPGSSPSPAGSPSGSSAAGSGGRRPCCSCSTSCRSGVALAMIDWRTRYLPSQADPAVVRRRRGASWWWPRCSARDWPELLSAAIGCAATFVRVLRDVVRRAPRRWPSATSGCPGCSGWRWAGSATPSWSSGSSPAFFLMSVGGILLALTKVFHKKHVPFGPVPGRRRLPRGRVPAPAARRRTPG